MPRAKGWDSRGLRPEKLRSVVPQTRLALAEVPSSCDNVRIRLCQSPLFAELSETRKNSSSSHLTIDAFYYEIYRTVDTFCLLQVSHKVRPISPAPGLLEVESDEGIDSANASDPDPCNSYHGPLISELVAWTKEVLVLRLWEALKIQKGR